MGLFPHTHACKAGLSGMRFSEGGQRLRVGVRVRVSGRVRARVRVGVGGRVKWRFNHKCAQL